MSGGAAKCTTRISKVRRKIPLWFTRVIRTVVFTNFRTGLSAVDVNFYQVMAARSITSFGAQ